ncbi:PilN domain-containing protein [Trinickia sp. EG282A]|uniref:PilN domain-containing protein n=1 Tax=Trinickia sp. EG282A TaxID=3237013 RepID=UPI0034D1A170
MTPLLTLDFARRGARNPRAGVALAIFAALAALFAGDALWHAYRANERAHDTLAAFVHLHAPAPSRHDSAASTPAARQQAKEINAVFSEITVPWQDLLAIVEGYREHDVALIGIDQSPAQGQIRITAEAKDFDAMVRYLKYLQGSALLREAVLNTHLVETTTPGVPVRFQITAIWRKP